MTHLRCSQPARVHSKSWFGQVPIRHWRQSWGCKYLTPACSSGKVGLVGGVIFALPFFTSQMGPQEQCASLPSQWNQSNFSDIWLPLANWNLIICLLRKFLEKNGIPNGTLKYVTTISDMIWQFFIPRNQSQKILTAVQIKKSQVWKEVLCGWPLS